MIRAAVFLGAFLLFSVQPLVARRLLPVMGGSALVWNTCMVFFQAALLLGYLYVFALSRWLGPRARLLVHLGVLAAGALALPLWGGMTARPPPGMHPSGWVLGVLVVTVGPPFVALAATAPLVQLWLGESDLEGAEDPYFLYAASNLGSLSALLAYPLLLEPALGVEAQRVLWARGYWLVAAALVVVGAWLVGRRRVEAEVDVEGGEEPGGQLGEAASPEAGAAPGWRDRAAWALLAFVPSLLLLGITAHLAEEVPSSPLLWVVPLALYLASFALVFARRALVDPARLAAVHPLALSVLAVFLYVPTRVSGFVVHLGALFVSCLVLHDQLARRRPPAARAPDFYLWVAAGGAAGGVLHSLVAPQVFPFVAELPLAICLAAALHPAGPEDEVAALAGLREVDGEALRAAVLGEGPGDLEGTGAEKAGPEAPAPEAPASEAPAPEASTAAGAPVHALAPAVPPPRSTLAAPTPGDLLRAGALLALGVGGMRALPLIGDFRDTVARVGLLLLVAMVVHTQRRRPTRLALGLAAVLTTGFVGLRLPGALHLARSPYGAYRVQREALGGRTFLHHGSTVQGSQQDALSGGPPSSYYHPEGPIGRLLRGRPDPTAPMAGVGLGVGALAWYLYPGGALRFYELDPLVLDLARDRRFFTLLAEARGPVDVVIGDGRLSLDREPAGVFHALMIDAFGSDAVPTHLLTREAVEGYLRVLAPGGALLVNVTNRHVAIAPVLAAHAHDLGLEVVGCGPRPLTPEESRAGMAAAQWLVITRDPPTRDAWTGDLPCFQPLAPGPGAPRWTDDRLSLLGVLRW